MVDPELQLRVINYRTGQEVGIESVGGDPLGFRIETNLYSMARRPDVMGAPITIHIRDPTGAELTSVGATHSSALPDGILPLLVAGAASAAAADCDPSPRQALLAGRDPATFFPSFG
jgi:hypothetical protein